MPTDAPDLPAGTLIDGKWLVEATLGRGGMGVVYAANHARNGLAVALKVLHAEAARDEVVRKRFLHEGYAANRVGHPGTVQVLDDGSTPEGIVYLVMERLVGRSLERVAEDAGGKLPPLDVLRYALAWVEVVAAAHARGIVHRDLKPENVMLCVDGRIKVLDFGLARVREAATSMARLTQTNSPMGTPAFMPPEQALAQWEQVDARSDVYALGASLFTMLTDRLVHEAATVPLLMVRVCTEQVRPIRTVRPEVPAPLARVIDRALAFDRSGRYADAQEMLADLRKAAVALKLGGPATMPGAVYDPGAAPDSGEAGNAPTTVFDQAKVFEAWGARAPDGRGGEAVLGRSPSPATGTLPSGMHPRQTVQPVSSGTERKREQRLRLGIVVAVLGVVAAGALIVLLRLEGASSTPSAVGSGPELAPTGTPGAPSTMASPIDSAPAEPATTASRATSASSARVAPAASVAPSSLPSATGARPPKKPPSPATRCKRDSFTLRCPCARCD